ncbi:MAG TPA: efflux transporter periplasmic adaptor subunit, partial [Anaeromyxobacter sp.]|nr:efflux transporter periplasmic adaptor subunit [Anaeromyxobacter sp.]
MARLARIAVVATALAATAAACSRAAPDADAARPPAAAAADPHEGHAHEAHAPAEVKPQEDWCEEHAVAESRCTKCNPRLVAKFVEAGDYCREHGYPESVCPICHPERVPPGKEPPVFPASGLKVRLASAQTARDAGIQTRVAEAGKVAKVLEVVGQ